MLELQKTPEIVSQILGILVLVHFSHEWVHNVYQLLKGVWDHSKVKN